MEDLLVHFLPLLLGFLAIKIAATAAPLTLRRRLRLSLLWKIVFMPLVAFVGRENVHVASGTVPRRWERRIVIQVDSQFH